jgi:iron complex transport system ATP-binding protein
MLRADHLTLARGDHEVVHEVSLTLPPGRLCAVVGENGAGKSTLLDGLAGLVRPTRGRVTLDDDELGALDVATRARRLASLPQQPVDAPGLNVRARIGHGLVPRRGPGALLDDEARALVADAATEVGVEALLDRPLRALSGGERRRVEVARVLVDRQAEVMLLDEPFAGVDVRHQPPVIAALRRRASEGAAVVVSVHQLDIVLRLADDVLALADGRQVAYGPLDDAFTDATLMKVFGLPARLVTDGEDRGVLFPSR